ncbi:MULTISPECIES: MFS transporter [Slackia]|uniref:MFS transporter n=2 Tax=Eggerthellaceae TaxID=1643826 RepID=UPI00027C4FE3|nr:MULTISPECIES: MFS transporter [Slackia]EJU32166.1 transporter, major facilitator family protein [Slackia sp. CM382]MCQ5091231.1 MFS transporter [Slackia exigua]
MHTPLQEFSQVEQQRTLKRVTFSSFLGNFIEWFDYASYSYLATVIAVAFFPDVDKAVATMYAFAVFAIAFLVRPIGAVFWGNMGDKKGRKWALSISILVMSGATFIIGCLPVYALAGMAAPVLLLLCRIVQSFSASGEYAGAATFIAEYAPRQHRGFYCSMVPASTAAGLLVGSLFATAMFAVWGATSDFVVTVGWRIPFWLAGPLGLITHYIRTHLEDSPVYEAMQRKIELQGDEGMQRPIRTLLSRYPRKVLICFGACMLNAVGFYMVLTYIPNYLEVTLSFDPTAASAITTIVLAAYIGFIFVSGRISDRVGRRRMLIIACVGFIAFTVPAFHLLGTCQFGVVLVTELVMCMILTVNDGTLSSYLTETFPTAVRYSGFAFSFNLANALFGGSASYISFWLINATGNAIAPAYYMIAIGLIALVAMIASHEHTGKDLNDVK